MKALSRAVLGETPEDLVEACVEAISNLCTTGSDEMVEAVHGLVFEFVSKIAQLVDSGEGDGDKKWWQYRLSVVLSESLKHMSLSTEVGAEVEAALMSVVGNETAETRERAVQGLGRLCLLSETRAQRFLPLLLNISVSSCEVLSVRGAAVQSLIDVMMMHESCAEMLRSQEGIETLTQLPAAKEWSSEFHASSEGGSNSDGVNSVIFQLLTYLMRNGGPMACLAAESTSKLIMNRRLGDEGGKGVVSLLVNSLVGIYFSTDQSKQQDMALGSTSRMQQVLTIFFKVFPPMTQYATLRAGLSSLIDSYINQEEEDNQAPLSKALLLYIDMLDGFEIATKQKKQSSAYVVLELCRALRTSSNSSDKSARKNMIKIFSSLDVPCLDNKGEVTDNELLKLVTLWCSQTAAHLTNLDGIACAKPIRKFVLSCTVNRDTYANTYMFLYQHPSHTLTPPTHPLTPMLSYRSST